MKNHVTKICFTTIITFFILQNTFAQQWERITPEIPCTNRHENALTIVGNDLVLLGGRGVKPVEVYDLGSNKWEKKVETPIEMHHFQAISYKGEVWVMNAFTGTYPHEMPIPNIHIFNPKKNKWRVGAEIPADRRRGAGGVVVHKNKIYMVCGIQDGHWDGHVAWLDEYDPETNTWKKLPDAPNARDHVNAVVVDNKLYVIGGRRSTAKIGKVLELTVSAIDVYDFETNTWASFSGSLSLPTERAGAAVVALGSKVFVMGGESAAQVPAHSEVEAYNTKTMAWEKMPNLIQGRHGTGAVSTKGKVYIVAGSGNRGGGPELNSIEVFKKED